MYSITRALVQKQDMGSLEHALEPHDPVRLLLLTCYRLPPLMPSLSFTAAGFWVHCCSFWVHYCSCWVHCGRQLYLCFHYSIRDSPLYKNIQQLLMMLKDCNLSIHLSSFSIIMMNSSGLYHNQQRITRNASITPSLSMHSNLVRLY